MSKPVVFIIILIACGLLFGQGPAFADSYLESFDSRSDGATVDGIDYWQVFQGVVTSAITQSAVTFQDTGKSLKLTGASSVVGAARSATYSGLTPTWIRFKVKAPQCSQDRDVPSSGIAALSFSYAGNVLANNGKAWIDTGQTYSTNCWYDAAMKLDFANHTYDLYFYDSLTSVTKYTPVKTGLAFIDSTYNSLNGIKFFGAYSKTAADDTYIDDISVTYFDHFSIITAAQKLLIDEASGPITVQLQDSMYNPQTAITDMILELKSTSAKGKFSLLSSPWEDTTQILLPKGAQSATFYYKDSIHGMPTITVSEYPDCGLIYATQQEEIINVASFFAVEALSPQVAGANFTLEITAKDEEGNVSEAYNGTVNLSVNYVSPEKGLLSLSSESISGFLKGTVSAVLTYPDCGAITITAADVQDPSKTGTSLQILFLPSSFTVLADASQIVSRAFDLTVTARNAVGDITANYNGSAGLYTSAVSPANIEGALISPLVITAADFKSGQADVKAAYNLYGTIKIRAEDSSDRTKQGASSDIVFRPKEFVISIDKSPGRDYFYVGEPIAIKVAAKDALDKAIINYSGKINLKASVNLQMPAEYSFVAEDKGEHKFLAVPTQSGTYTVALTAEGGLFKAESEAITVKNATLEVIDTVSPVGTGEVIIQLVDDTGKIISTENNLPINVKTMESIDNKTASFPGEAITLTEGRATIPVYNSEAEIITIIPSSTFKINIRKGTITFGRAGKTGIAPLLWREIKKKK